MNVINGRYKLEQKLGEGAFSAVCKARCLHTGKVYAVKLDTMKEQQGINLLKHEATLLHYLQQQKCGDSIPQVHYYGFHEPFTCLLMTYCDKVNLHKCTEEEKLSWWNAMLDVLEKIHKCGIVHRDLKPDHFMKQNGRWVLMDFGLANTYLDSEGNHTEDKPCESIVGSPNYVSYYVHCGHLPSRRDDLISLFYIFWEVLFGSFVDKSKQLFSETYSLDSIYHPYNDYVKHLKKWETLEENMNQYTHELKIFMNSMLKYFRNILFETTPSYKAFVVLLRK